MSLAQRISVIVLAPVLLLSLTHAAAQTASANAAALASSVGSPVSESLWTRTIQSDLIAEKFDELDSMADQYRSEKTRLPGGQWRLSFFYGALDAPQQTDKDTEDHIAHLEQWVKLRPHSITARVALATSLHRWAWVARGTGFAKTVTPEGWRLFYERIARSQSVLEEAENLSTMCPQWYSEMMTVGLAQKWDLSRMQEIFNRGIQFEPDYYYLYEDLANYLLPKWRGHPGDSSAFARSSADALGGDAGDILYYQIAGVLVNRSNPFFPTSELDWDRIQRGYQDLTAKYGGDVRTRNQIAYMAWKFNDTAVASRQFALIGSDWSLAVWGTRLRFDRARDWSQLPQGSAPINDQ